MYTNFLLQKQKHVFICFLMSLIY